MKSQCCQAALRVEGTTTKFWLCDECGQASEPAEIMGFRLAVSENVPTGEILMGSTCPPWCHEHPTGVHSAAKITGVE